MRILQIAQKRQRRGAEIFAAQLGEWLRGSGQDVRHVYLYRYGGAEPLALLAGDVDLERSEGSPLERLPSGHPLVLRRLLGQIRRYDPDVVQANGGRSVKYAALAALLSPGRRWKLVYRNIDSPRFWVRGRARRLYFRGLVMPRVDGVVGVSRQTLAEVFEFYGLGVPGEFIPNGITLGPLDGPADREAVRADLGVSPGQVVVLFFGALTAQKRPDRYVRSIRSLRSAGEDVAGWVLGDGPGRAEMEARARELGVAASIRFLGYRERVADLVAASDLLASTSDSEGIPAAVLEAGYLRVPTVGFDVGGMRECVLHGETGLLAARGDEEAHLQATLRLVRDGAERRRLGVAARAFVQAEFSMDAVGRRYTAFYERILADRTRPSET